MKYVLYNPLASNKTGEKIAKQFVVTEGLDKTPGDLVYRNITTLDLRFQLASLYPGDDVYIVGGGGTILRFAQEIRGMEIKNNLYFSPSGAGNDFFNDIAKPGEKYTRVNDYIKHVHKCEIEGKKRFFLTDVGLGVDGFSCACGEDARAKDSTKEFNYSKAVIDGVLSKYDPCGCSVIVDGGEEEYFENVWVASTMAGTMYGGGVKIAPTYNRLTADYLELVIFENKSRLGTLMKFPNFIKGTHEGKIKGSHVFRGKRIEVYFTKPRDAQIDGEVFRNVKHYVAEF